ALSIAGWSDPDRSRLQAPSRRAVSRRPRRAHRGAHQSGAGVLMKRVVQECRNARMQTLCIVALLHFCILAFSPAARAEVIDRVLAVVNGEVITLTDVTAARDLGLVTANAGADSLRPMLLALVDRSLELDEVNRYAPPEPTLDAVERELQVVRG